MGPLVVALDAKVLPALVSVSKAPDKLEYSKLYDPVSAVIVTTSASEVAVTMLLTLASVLIVLAKAVASTVVSVVPPVT